MVRGEATAGTGERGAIALLVLTGGGLAVLIALVLLTVVADLVITRGQAQIAADAAALGAMAQALEHPGGAAGADAADTGVAAALAEANGGEALSCCGDDPARREVEVGVVPASVLLRAVVPRVRARAAAALEAVGPPTPELAGGGPVSAAGPPAAGDRVWPAEGRVSSGFGPRVHPVTGHARLHAGLDIAAPAGTPIRAAAAGRVVAAGRRGGYGLTVDVRHPDGIVTRYAHQSRLLVAPGQVVAAGQVIGLIGSTGVSTGPHLHFEVRTATGPVDPRPWLP